MKHLKLFVALFAMLALGVGNAWAETATITFKNQSSGTSDGSTAYTISNFVSSGIASSDAAFGTITCSATSKCYSGKTGMGLKAGGSSAAGSFTITFSTPLVNVSKVTLNAAAYRSDKSVDITVKNGSTQLSKITSITKTTLYDIDIADLNIASFNTLTIESTKYCYIKSITITYNPSAGGETVDSPVFSSTEANFTEAFNLTITSAEGTTLKYTTDKTDPTTSATAVVVENNTATVAIPAKSTMVKAIAVKGELVSNVKSMTFCYINSAETAYTVTEALEVYNAGLGLDNSLYIQGTVKSITEMNTTQYYNANYTITDRENDLYIFRGKGIDGADFTSESQLLVGDDLVIYGKLSEYQGNPQVAQDSKIISRVSTTKAIIAENLTFDAIALGDEVEAQILTVTGANLTADIAATLDNEKFTVTPATLPAAGGDLTITPAADLTVGEHTATLTLTSGETVKEVALSILVKDIYSINWSVNGTIANETKVVAGDKLVLPVAPAAPDACSEKVFVGWATTSTVNADGSDIDYVTDATVPTESTTYYAVFATQEGEGGIAEIVDVLNNALTGISGTTYASWSDKTATSAAVYAGQSAGDNETIQLRSKNSNSGVISTTSGGKLAKVTVTWNSNTAADRTLDVYGSNTAYTNPTDLYNSEKRGDKLGAIVKDTSTELVIDGDYAYVGLRSNDGAMYLDEIQITWTAGAAATYTNYSTTCDGTSTDIENIAVEGKAVKAIVNGQLIIIKNGVQYNAQGQVIK